MLLKQLLHSLFVLCFAEGILPSLWRKAIIHKIPKLPGRQIDPLQYRGLALQCCIFKVLSAIVNDRIVKHLNENDILSDEQNGFRKKRSCQQHVHSLMTLVRNHCTSKNSVYCAFIDFQKAFDFINRKLLFYKLKQFGIDGKIHNLIDQFYSDTGNLLRINGHFTEEITNNNGVLQGNNLSPTLFSCYIDGLIQELNQCNEGIMLANGRSVCVLAYADDIVLISKTSTGLQKLLDVTDNWCKSWRVQINSDKTKVLEFRKNKVKSTGNCQFKIGNSCLEVVDRYKYLGIVLNYNLDVKRIGRWRARARTCIGE